MAPTSSFSLDRRRLLTATAAIATAAIAPEMKLGAAEAIREAPPPPPLLNLTGANARRLAEIARRNVIRQEAGLPLLAVPRELRRLKQAEDAAELERFEAKHGKTIWEQVLKSRREAEGNPNWRPNWMEGLAYQSQVRKILREQFYAARRRA
jgi:hypothetical protein